MEAVGAWGGAGVTARAQRIRRVPAPARVPRQGRPPFLPPSLRVRTAQAAAGALTGRGGPGNKDAIMNVPCGGGSRSPRGPRRGKGGRAGRPRAEPTAGTRAGAVPRPTVCAPRGARWRPASVAPPSAFLPVPSRSFSSAILVRSPSPGRCP